MDTVDGPGVERASEPGGGGDLAGSRGLRLALLGATVVVTLVGVACLLRSRVALSGTFDESNHLAAGLEWWQFGTYTQWTENPPLARVAIAAVPYLRGMRLPPPAVWDPRTHEWDRSWEMGTDRLYGGKGFEQNLADARLGTFPFFLIALAAVWGLAGGRRRAHAGFIAVALTATLPALVSHGALATTDVPFTAMYLVAVLALWRWFNRPGNTRALALGAAVGGAVLAKLSALVFFPIAVVAAMAARRISRVSARPLSDGRPLVARRLATELGLAVVTAGLVVWAGYRFSIGRIDALPSEVKGWLQLLPPASERTGLTGLLLRIPLPMPELFHGIRFLAAHDAAGHEAYLLGRVSEHGFVAFYPIALLVKTPLPFLIALLACLPLLLRSRGGPWEAQAALLAAAGILVVSMRSHVNLGIRHVFVLLPLLAAAIGRAGDIALRAWPASRRRWAAAVIGVLLVAQSTTTLSAGATTLGQFNLLAGREPAEVLLDSDLDWGQDLFALRREVRRRGIDRLAIGFFGMLRLCRHDLPPLVGLVPGRPTTGWIAISENYYRHRSTFMLLKDPCDPRSVYRDDEVPAQGFRWLHAHAPVAIAGSSVRLYHIVPPTDLPESLSQ